jgi:hypothetical protein
MRYMQGWFTASPDVLSADSKSAVSDAVAAARCIDAVTSNVTQNGVDRCWPRHGMWLPLRG